MGMASERLYPVAPALKESGEWIKGATFMTGVTSGGEQLILCYAGGRRYAHRFSPVGEYLGRISREVANWDDVLAWIGELEMVPVVVLVRKFHSGFDSPTPDGFDGPTLAIHDHPSHFDDGDFESEEDREATIRSWHDRGEFVLFWDTTEHWMVDEEYDCLQRLGSKSCPMNSPKPLN
jgi:hypothetical protein